MFNSASSNDTVLLRVKGPWWVRRGCVAGASDGFQKQLPPPPKPWWQTVLGRLTLPHWLFSLREGEGLLAARGLRLLELAVTPDKGLAVQLDRVIAFEPSLSLRTRYVRRIPMSGAGAKHVGFFTGTGRVIAAAISCLQQVEIDATADTVLPADVDFDPEAVVAWSSDLKFRFTLYRLTWSTFLSPRGFRETRMTFTGAGLLWLDAGCEPAPLARARSRQLPAGPFGAR